MKDDVVELLSQVKAALAVKRPFWYFLLVNTTIKYKPDADLIVDKDGIVLGDSLLNTEKPAEHVIRGLWAHVQMLPWRKERFRGVPDKFDYWAGVKYRVVEGNGRQEFKHAGLDELLVRVEKCSIEELAESEVPIEGIVTRFPEIKAGVFENAEVIQVGEQGADAQSFDEAESRVRELITRAAIFSKMAGREDPTAKRLIEQMYPVRKLTWDKYLQNLLETELRKVVQTYTKVNRRVDTFPGRQFRGARVAVAIDVSGSISDELYSKFVSVVVSLARRGLTVDLLFWDTMAKYVGSVKTESQLVRQAKDVTGYGGTCPDCLVPELKRLNPQITVVLTDGHWADDHEFKSWARGKKVILATTEREHGVFWREVKVE